MVFSLARSNGVEAALDPAPDMRFAELWVGTHPSGCCQIHPKAQAASTMTTTARGAPQPAALLPLDTAATTSDTAAHTTTATASADNGVCSPQGAAAAATATAAAAAATVVSLESWLSDHPEALGSVLAASRPPDSAAGRLPFLMKVLSINKALPLQAHPTPAAAKALHNQKPEVYPDDAAKPEMVVALSNFCGFAGFLTYDKMKQLLCSFSPLKGVLGELDAQAYLAAGPGDVAGRQQALAAMVEQLLLRTPAEACHQVLSQLLQHLQGEAAGIPPGSSAMLLGGEDTSSGNINHASPAGPSAHEDLSAADPRIHDFAQHAAGAKLAAEAAVLEGPENVPKGCDLALAYGLLNQSTGQQAQRHAMLSAAAMAWPQDPAAVLALALMEDVVLQKGEAVLIPAGCPHAYVCGEVLEIQAASNNTIKGGLTAPDEATDKENLVAVITSGLAGISTSSNGSNLDPAATSSPAGLFEGAPDLIYPVMPGAGTAASDALQLYQPPVQEFQLWHVTGHAGQGEVSLVVDPGPGTLLVTGGSGKGVVKAGVVVDQLLMDEPDMQPGDAFFVPAGSSVCFSASSSSVPEALDLWMTTANNRFFARAAAPAGATAASPPPGLKDAKEAGGSGINQATALGSGRQQSGGGTAKAVGAPRPATFTAAEQAAAAIMAGAAHSSTPVNAADATAAALAGVGQLQLMSRSEGPTSAAAAAGDAGGAGATDTAEQMDID